MSDHEPIDTPDDSIGPPAPAADATHPGVTHREPAPDSLRTQAPPRYPETRPGPDPTDGRLDVSIPTRFPVASDATATPESTARETPTAGEIPGYELIEPLGEGGMGEVWKARQVRLNRMVALKMVLGGHRVGSRELIRFLAEAEAVAAIRHPHVVQVHEYGEAAGRPFLAMEYLPGGSLTDRLKQAGRLDPIAAALLVATLADAIQAAHDQGIVHRDLKPANVLFDEAGQPRVTDFGLAKRAMGNDMTATLAVMGTPAYMAPEQARGNTKFVGPQADVYSLGVILYECLTGTRPFDDTSQMALLRKVVEEEPRRPGKHVPGLPGDIELICMKCLEKDPRRRYASAHALAEDLRAWLSSRPIAARRVGAAERAWLWGRRRPAVAGLLAALAMMMLVAFVTVTALWLRSEGLRAEAAANAEGLARQLYINRVNLASREALDNRVSVADHILADCDPAQRGWEWSYCRGLCHRELSSVSLAESGWPSAVALSPDGRLLASVWQDQSIVLSDPSTGAVLRTLRGHTDVVDALAFSRDGRLLASAGRDRAIRIWDPRDGKVLRLLDGHAFAVQTLAFSPVDDRLVSATGAALSLKQVSEVFVWDAAIGEKLFTLPTEGVRGTYVAFSPDGLRIAAAPWWGPRVTVWDPRRGTPVASLRYEKTGAEGTTALAFGPNGLVAFSDQHGSMTLWNSEDRAPPRTLVAQGQAVGVLTFSRDGRQVASGCKDASIKLFDVATGSEIDHLRGHTAAIAWMSFARDGRTLMSVSGDRTLKSWPTAAEGRSAVRGQPGWAFRVRFSRDGSRLAASHYGVVRIQDFGTGRLLARLLLGGGVQGLDFSPDGRFIATTDEFSNEAVVWEAATARPAMTLMGHSAPLRTIAYSPDGRYLATASEDKTVRLWDVASGKALRAFSHDDAVFAVAFHPNAREIATLDWSGTVRLWEITSGRQIRRLKAPKARNNVGGFGDALAFDRDGRRLAVAADDGSARIFSVESGRELRALRGHSGEVHCVAFSPDGRRVVTAAADATIKLWDPDNGDEIFTLRGHVGEVLGVAFRTDGRILASAGIDGDIRIWSGEPTPPDVRRARHASEAVDALLFRPLSTQQRLERLRDDKALDDPTRVEAIEIVGGLQLGQIGLDRLAEMAARIGRWPEAAGAYEQLASRSRPGETARYLAALTRIRIGDLPGYRALCAAELDALGPSSEPDRANRVARNCVIGPIESSGPAAESVVRLAESAVAGLPGPLRSAALNILGAALYRAGRYDEAILRLNESLAKRDGPETGQDWAFLAMSYHRAGNEVEASRWIEKLVAWAPSGDPLRFWSDIEVGLLRDEALALAKGPPHELPADVFAH